MSRRISIMYTIASSIALPFYFLLAKTTIEGEHFVPHDGAAIIVSNHLSFIDPLSLGYLAHRRKRQVHFLAKDSLFKNPISRWFLLSCGQIPVARGTTHAADSLIYACEALEKNHVVGLYPESTMPEDLVQLPIKSGALRLAAETGAPLIVLGTWGAHDTWRKGRKPKPRFRRKHAMVVLPPYIIAADDDIEEARKVLASKMLDATAKARAKIEGRS